MIVDEICTASSPVYLSYHLGLVFMSGKTLSHHRSRESSIEKLLAKFEEKSRAITMLFFSTSLAMFFSGTSFFQAKRFSSFIIDLQNVRLFLAYFSETSLVMPFSETNVEGISAADCILDVSDNLLAEISEMAILTGIRKCSKRLF